MRVLAVMAVACVVACGAVETSTSAGNPAERVLGMLGKLSDELSSEVATRGSAFKEAAAVCSKKERDARAKVDEKNKEVRGVMDQVAAAEKSILEKQGLLTRVQMDRGASEKLINAAKVEQASIAENLRRATDAGKAATEQHKSSVAALDKAFGVTSSVIAFMRRAYERQAATPVVLDAKDYAKLKEVETTTTTQAPIDMINPKENGIRGAMSEVNAEVDRSADPATPKPAVVTKEDVEAATGEVDTPLPATTAAAAAAPPAPVEKGAGAAGMSFKRVFSNLFDAKSPLAPHRHTQTATELMAAISKFQRMEAPKTGRHLLADPKGASARQSMSQKIYELLRKLEDHIKTQREQRTTSHESAQEANGKLVRALTKQQAQIEARLAKEARKKLPEQAATLEADLDTLKSTVTKSNKLLNANRNALVVLDADLDAVTKKCTEVEAAHTTFKDETKKQNGIIGDVREIITDRVAKVRALLEKNLGDVKGLVAEAAKPTVKA